MSEAFVAASDLRLDDGGVPVVDGLSFESHEGRLVVLGAERALFEAMAGLRSFERGQLSILGERPRDALAKGLVAAAPLDPPLPPRMTVLDYVTWSARLGGAGAGDGRADARTALDALELTALAKSKLASLGQAARRATVLASALATRPEALLFEDPSPGLDEAMGRELATRLAAALDGMRFVAFASRLALASPLASIVDEVIVVHGSEVEVQASPFELAGLERTYLVRLVGDREAFLARMSAEGASVTAREASVVVQLSEQQTTGSLARAAHAAGAAIVELLPLSHRIT